VALSTLGVHGDVEPRDLHLRQPPFPIGGEGHALLVDEADAALDEAGVHAEHVGDPRQRRPPDQGFEQAQRPGLVDALSRRRPSLPRQRPAAGLASPARISRPVPPEGDVGAGRAHGDLVVRAGGVGAAGLRKGRQRPPQALQLLRDPPVALQGEDLSANRAVDLHPAVGLRLVGETIGSARALPLSPRRGRRDGDAVVGAGRVLAEVHLDAAMGRRKARALDRRRPLPWGRSAWRGRRFPGWHGVPIRLQ